MTLCAGVTVGTLEQLRPLSVGPIGRKERIDPPDLDLVLPHPHIHEPNQSSKVSPAPGVRVSRSTESYGMAADNPLVSRALASIIA
jgi:hypothetical protein